MTQQWFVVRTKAGKEVMASVSVASKDGRYAAFLPITLVERSHAGKRERVPRPLFPRYLFVQFDREDYSLDYGSLNFCRGVASRGLMVDGDNRPIPIPNAVIEGIKHREKLMMAKAGEIKSGWVPGDRFKLQVGPYADFDVTYMGEDKGQVWVSVSMFGMNHAVPVPFEAIPPCENVIDRLSA